MQGRLGHSKAAVCLCVQRTLACARKAPLQGPGGDLEIDQGHQFMQVALQLAGLESVMLLQAMCNKTCQMKMQCMRGTRMAMGGVDVGFSDSPTAA